MENEITVSPLVDILSLSTTRRVAMSQGEYIYLSDKSKVEVSEIDKAVLLQNEEQTKAELNLWKQKREEKVQKIVVPYNGNIYQGDEKSQDRMSRAVNALTDGSMPWTTATNAIVDLTKVDLKNILLLAGTEQSRIWHEGRP